MRDAARLRKPSRFEERRSLDYNNLDRSLAHPKNRPYRNARCRAFVRSFGCFVRGKEDHICGPRVDGKVLIDCAHLGTSGMSSKSDDRRSVGLCHDAHMELHRIGQRKFDVKYDVNLEARAAELREMWDAKTGGAR